jgi:pyrimidine/purine-5'-nucleotide nucleosidase
VRNNRLDTKDAFFFNWALQIPLEFQLPFRPTHAAMRALQIHHDRPRHELAADLRRAFSGIVAGNVKEEGVRAIEEHGPFDIDGDVDIMRALDKLLQAFVEQHRMKLPGGAAYVPCYRVLTS